VQAEIDTSGGKIGMPRQPQAVRYFARGENGGSGLAKRVSDAEGNERLVLDNQNGVTGKLSLHPVSFGAAGAPTR
jgi:hypothetical protein